MVIVSRCRPRNVAVTIFVVSKATWHGPSPEHAPVHPAKTESAAGAASSVTTVSGTYEYEQVCEEPATVAHVAPGGATVTEPAPESALATSTTRSIGPRKLAVTERAWGIASEQDAAPIQSDPAQPRNTVLGGVTGSSTTVAAGLRRYVQLTEFDPSGSVHNVSGGLTRTLPCRPTTDRDSGFGPAN